MLKNRVGILFSRELVGVIPLDHIGVKLPVYLRLLELCQNAGWESFVLTRKTYIGDGVFEGAWKFDDGKFEIIRGTTKIDLVYDRSAGINFPPEEKTQMRVVNKRDFKILAWDKWKAYKEIGNDMAKTFWVGKKENLKDVLPKIKTDFIVLKPYNGLKGIGIFIGPKIDSAKFIFVGKNPKYIAQEFIDTSGGIPMVTSGLHDLRIAIVNGKPVWAHVRVPPAASLRANVAEGGTLTEVDYKKVPLSVKKIVGVISDKFYKKYDNPTYSLDFGIGKNGIPKIFEINDQIGFPTWEMKNRDVFLKELVESFRLKLN